MDEVVEGKLVLKELLAAEILIIDVSGPEFAKPLVREVLAEFQDVQPRHQSRGQGRAAGAVPVNPAELLFEERPIDPLRKLDQPVIPIDEIVEPRPEHIPLPGIAPLPWLHPSLPPIRCKRSESRFGAARKQSEEFARDKPPKLAYLN
jgi:hypothetical protein